MLLASLLIASFVIFGALYLAPGNPISALSGGRALPPASLHVLEQRYHLNQPFLAQYWYWLDNALHGNLGISITLQQNVSSVIAGRMWTTGGLVLYAAIIILIVGIGSGGVAALLQNAANHNVVAATVQPTGQLAIFGETNDGNWALRATVGASGAFPSGAPVALDFQNTTQLDAFVVSERVSFTIAEQA